jgi:ABC-type Fe3+/spermidine/putrescine transport system ATPase subunit
VEVRRIQRSLGITTIYVTHDQQEALSISDKVVVMRTGKVMAVGPPKEIYTRPSNDFVASFVGKANLIPGRLVNSTGRLAKVSTAIGDVRCGLPDGAAFKPGDEVIVSIKPENVLISANGGHGDEQNTFKGLVEFTSYLGAFSEVLVSLGGDGSDQLRVRVVKASEGVAVEDGQKILVTFPAQYCAALPPGTALDFRKRTQSE